MPITQVKCGTLDDNINNIIVGQYLGTYPGIVQTSFK